MMDITTKALNYNAYTWLLLVDILRNYFGAKYLDRKANLDLGKSLGEYLKN